MDRSLRARSRRAPAPAGRGPGTSTSSVRAPRSRPANWYSDSVSGTGVTAPRIVAGSAPSATATGNGVARMRQRVVAEVERAAAMREPAHDDLVAARSPAGGRCRGSAASCCGPRVTTRPQVMSGPASPGQQVWIGRRAEIDVVAFPARSPGRARARRAFGAMSSTCLQQRQLVPRVAQAPAAARAPSGTRAARRSRAAPRPIASAPMPSATRCGVPNRLPSTGIVWPVGLLEQQRRPAAPSARGRRSRSSRAADRLSTRDALQLAARFELGDEIAQVAVRHVSALVSQRRAGCAADEIGDDAGEDRGADPVVVAGTP